MSKIIYIFTKCQIKVFTKILDSFNIFLMKVVNFILFLTVHQLLFSTVREKSNNKIKFSHLQLKNRFNLLDSSSFGQ